MRHAVVMAGIILGVSIGVVSAQLPSDLGPWNSAANLLQQSEVVQTAYIEGVHDGYVDANTELILGLAFKRAPADIQNDMNKTIRCFDRQAPNLAQFRVWAITRWRASQNPKDGAVGMMTAGCRK